jgi:hypothetical protein
MAINIPIISKFDNKGVKDAQGAFAGIGKSLGGLAAVAGAAFASIGIAQFAKDSVKAASDLSESINAVNVAYGDFADDVLALGDDVASRLGLSQVDFNAAAVRFSAFTERIAGEGGDVSQVVDSLTTRAADFASVFNIDVAEALRVFQSGLAGEAEPLKRFGINLLESEVKAYALRAGIIQVGQTMSETQKVQARYGLLMESTNKTAGDFANTSDGLANSQRILSATMEDMRAKVGEGLAPAIATVTAALVPLATSVFPKLGEVVTNVVGPAVQKMADYFAELVLVGTTLGGDNVLAKVFNDIKDAVTGFISEGGLGQAVQAFSDFRYQVFSAIIEMIPAIIEGLAEFLPQIISFFSKMYPEMLAQVSTLFEQVLAVFIEIMPTLIAGFTSIVPQLIQLLADLAPLLVENILTMLPQILEAAVETFNGLVEALVVVLPILLKAILGMLPDIIASVISMLPKLIESAIELFSGLITALIEVIPMLIEAIVDALPLIMDALIDALPLIIDAAFQLFTGITTALLDAWPLVLAALVSLFPLIFKAIGDYYPRLFEAGGEIIAGLAKGIVEAIPKVIGSAINAIGTALTNGVNAIFQIKSPSRVFMGIGENVVAGLGKGIDDNLRLLEDASVGMTSTVTATTVGGLSGFSAPIPTSAQSSQSKAQTFNITVNAGVGADGNRIGEQIVNEILRFERSSGRVFARA